MAAEELLLRLEIEALQARYIDCLDNGPIEDWPELFTDDCFYQVIARENHDQGYPLAAIRCESRGMLEDRVKAVTETFMYEPRYMRHTLGGMVVKRTEGGVIETHTNYAVFETLPDEYTRVFNVGRYIDQLVRLDGELKFLRKVCVFDSEMVPNSLVYPI